MTNKRISLLTGASAFVLAAGAALAGGSFQTLPVIGGASYCASTSTTSGGQTCTQTVPAGPPTFTGSEVVPMDLSAPGSNNGNPVNTALANIQQLWQGQLLDVTTVATATIPAGVTFYALDGAQGSAFTITMPAVAVDGQIQKVICEAATVGALTVAANTTVVTQVLKGNPSTACVAGTAYNWRYNAANLTWYRV